MPAPNNSAIKRANVDTLFSVFKARVDLSPQNEAFRYYDANTQQWNSINWITAYQRMIAVRNALLAKDFHIGDRILLVMDNCPTWTHVEQAALYMGLVVVALPASLSAGAICDIAAEVDAKIIFIDTDNIWQAIQSNPFVKQNHLTIVCRTQPTRNAGVLYFDQWQKQNTVSIQQGSTVTVSEDALATIIYTSGSCGKPKGVKHSHKNLLNNAFACLKRFDVDNQDTLLSVTPISHCMERIAGYYVAIIAGASIVFPRSSDSILDDLTESNATILITTPHRLTKAYKRLLDNLLISAKLVDQYLDYLQGSDKWRMKFLFFPFVRRIIEKKTKKLLLHKLKFVMCGGSALSPKIIRLTQLLNLPVMQGYGLTEAGGIVSTNSTHYNQPYSVGKALSNTQIRITPENELQVRNDSTMLGYWNDNLPASKPDDWLQTNDLAHIHDDFLFIDGRKNETIHLSTGITVLPLPIEQHLAQHALFENVMLFGENKENLSLFCQLNRAEWQIFREKYAKRKELKNEIFTERLKAILLIRVNAILQHVAGHPHIYFIFPMLKTWSLDNGLLSSKGKVNKDAVEEYFARDIETLD